MARRSLSAPAGKVLARKFSANLFKRRPRPVSFDFAAHPPTMPRDSLDLSCRPVQSGFFGHSIDAEGVAHGPGRATDCAGNPLIALEMACRSKPARRDRTIRTGLISAFPDRRRTSAFPI